MSHFSRLKTQMADRALLVQAVQDLGYSCQVGDLQLGGFGGNRAPVEVKVRTRAWGYGIGFRKAGDTYECVADWWGVRGVKKQDFLRQVTQRYAYNAVRAKLTDQGFEVASDEVDERGRIHVVLRRMA